MSLYFLGKFPELPGNVPNLPKHPKLGNFSMKSALNFLVKRFEANGKVHWSSNILAKFSKLIEEVFWVSWCSLLIFYGIFIQLVVAVLQISFWKNLFSEEVPWTSWGMFLKFAWGSFLNFLWKFSDLPAENLWSFYESYLNFLSELTSLLSISEKVPWTFWGGSLKLLEMIVAGMCFMNFLEKFPALPKEVPLESCRNFQNIPAFCTSWESSLVWKFPDLVGKVSWTS